MFGRTICTAAIVAAVAVTGGAASSGTSSRVPGALTGVWHRMITGKHVMPRLWCLFVTPGSHISVASLDSDCGGGAPFRAHFVVDGHHLTIQTYWGLCTTEGVYSWSTTGYGHRPPRTLTLRPVRVDKCKLRADLLTGTWWMR
jgi:hypothetical protein